MTGKVTNVGFSEIISVDRCYHLNAAGRRIKYRPQIEICNQYPKVMSTHTELTAQDKARLVTRLAVPVSNYLET